jgi:hypothetical protein
LLATGGGGSALSESSALDGYGKLVMAVDDLVFEVKKREREEERKKGKKGREERGKERKKREERKKKETKKTHLFLALQTQNHTTLRGSWTSRATLAPRGPRGCAVARCDGRKREEKEEEEEKRAEVLFKKGFSLSLSFSLSSFPPNYTARCWSETTLSRTEDLCKLNKRDTRKRKGKEEREEEVESSGGRKKRRKKPSRPPSLPRGRRLSFFYLSPSFSSPSPLQKDGLRSPSRDLRDDAPRSS